MLKISLPLLLCNSCSAKNDLKQTCQVHSDQESEPVLYSARIGRSAHRTMYHHFGRSRVEALQVGQCTNCFALSIFTSSLMNNLRIPAAVRYGPATLTKPLDRCQALPLGRARRGGGVWAWVTSAEKLAHIVNTDGVAYPHDAVIIGFCALNKDGVFSATQRIDSARCKYVF